METQDLILTRDHRQLPAILQKTLLDQIMIDPLHGGANGRGPCAFAAVIDAASGRSALGIAVADELGYAAIPLSWARYPTHDLAAADARRLNADLGHATDTADRIVASTMGGRTFNGKDRTCSPTTQI